MRMERTSCSGGPQAALVLLWLNRPAVEEECDSWDQAESLLPSLVGKLHAPNTPQPL